MINSTILNIFVVLYVITICYMSKTMLINCIHWSDIKNSSTPFSQSSQQLEQISNRSQNHRQYSQKEQNTKMNPKLDETRKYLSPTRQPSTYHLTLCFYSKVAAEQRPNPDLEYGRKAGYFFPPRKQIATLVLNRCSWQEGADFQF